MKFIDLHKQQNLIREKIEVRIASVLDHGQYIMGPEVTDLELKLAKYVGTNHCITCSSGTDALLIPLLANNIGPGDAVLTTPFTYIATAEVIKLVGATPIFIDIDRETFNIDPSLLGSGIEHALKNGLNPKAIIPVDLFGNPANYIDISNFARKNKMLVLEDAAQGFGGSINDQKVGSFGNVAATSFFPAKPLGCYGDGGAIFTDDSSMAEKMISIRVHGSGIDKYDNVRLGINGRLDTIQAAILLEKLNIFDNEVKIRNKIADYYSNNISNFFIKPTILDGYISSWAQYSILVENKDHRDAVMLHLKSHDIPSMIYYRIPLHLQSVFKYLNISRGEFPISEQIAERILSLPMHPYIDKAQQDSVIEVLNSFEI